MILRPDQSVALLRNITEQQKEQSIITPIADTGVKEVQTVVCPATAGATQADYFVFYNKAGTSYAAWLDIDDAGTTPTGAAYLAADTTIECNIATGDTAAQAAAKIKTAIEAAIADITVSIDTATLTLTQDLMGNTTAPARHNADDSGNGSFTVATLTGGVASNLNSKYFTINSPTVSYYVWLNVNSEGVDPAPGGTGLEVAVAAGATAATVAAAINTVLDNHAAFVSVLDSTNNVVYCTNAAFGEATNLTVGNSPFSVAVGNQGVGDLFTPYMNVATLSNSPSLIAALS